MKTVASILELEKDAYRIMRNSRKTKYYWPKPKSLARLKNILAQCPKMYSGEWFYRVDEG